MKKILNRFSASILFLILLQISFVARAEGDHESVSGFPEVKNYTINFSDKWGDIKPPYPTSAWFTNAVVGERSPIYNGDTGKLDTPAPVIPLITPLPYEIKMQSDGMEIAMPSLTAEEVVKGGDWQRADFLDAAALKFGAFEFRNSKLIWKAENWTPLSITFRWKDGDKYISSPIVRGSPYITLFYHDLKPYLKTGMNIRTVNGKSIQEGPFKGTQFEIRIENSVEKGLIEQVWRVYSEKEIQFQKGDDAQMLIATEPYKGWVRVALLEDPFDPSRFERHKDSWNTIQMNGKLLNEYSHSIPTGASVNLNAKTGHITFEWTTYENHSQPPLILSLPHQREIGVTSLPSTSIKINTMKGPMLGVVSSTWSMQEKLPEIKWLELDQLAQLVGAEYQGKKISPEDQKAEILKALAADENDMTKKLPKDAEHKPKYYNDEDPYTYGKTLAKTARLALIANFMGDKKNETEFLKQLEGGLEELRTKKILSYDPFWRLIARSTAFYPDQTDKKLQGNVTMDFGAGPGTDHHFHYGYIVYAFAVACYLDPSFKETDRVKWIKTLVRDYAAQKGDTVFPPARYQDDFDGHSWASGMVDHTHGKNQESTSEAANSYYAVALLGKVLNDADMEAWGRFLLAREIRAAKTYWQISEKGERIYYPVKLINDEQGKPKKIGYIHKVVANVWSNTADYSSLFTSKPEYNYGIEMIPFTPISHDLLESWISEIVPELQQAYDLPYSDTLTSDGHKGTTRDWKPILIKGIVMGDRNQFGKMWEDTLELQPGADFNNGDSKTNTLFSIAASHAKPKS